MVNCFAGRYADPAHSGTCIFSMELDEFGESAFAQSSNPLGCFARISGIHDKCLSRRQTELPDRQNSESRVGGEMLARHEDRVCASRAWLLRCAEPDIHLRSWARRFRRPLPKIKFGTACQPRNFFREPRELLILLFLRSVPEWQGLAGGASRQRLFYFSDLLTGQ